VLTKVAADELGRYGTAVNTIAPAARTRLTQWLPDSPGADPWAPEHVAPVVAWLLGPDAREVTGRVIEVGNQHVSVPDGWRPGRPTRSPNFSTVQADTLLRRVLAAAAAPPALLGTEAG
jgi:hypothetical protein